MLIPLLLYVVEWRTVMLICSVVGIVVMAVWRFAYPKLLTDMPLAKSEPDKKDVAVKSESTSALPKFVYAPIVFIMLGIILQGILRDGVAGWMPSYLHETFSIPEEKAIISTVIQAVFSMLSFYVFDLVHRKLFKNEVFCSAVI